MHSTVKKVTWLVGLAGLLSLGGGAPAQAQGEVKTQQEIAVSATFQIPGGIFTLAGTVHAVIHTVFPAEPDPCFLVAVHLDFHDVTATVSGGHGYLATNNVEFHAELPEGTFVPFGFGGEVRFIILGSGGTRPMSVHVEASGVVVKSGDGLVTGLVFSPGGP
jgi:hypothetical protein